METPLHGIRQWRCFQSGPDLKITYKPTMALHSVFYNLKICGKGQASLFTIQGQGRYGRR